MAAIAACAGPEPAPLVGGGPPSAGSTASPGVVAPPASASALPALSDADTLVNGFQVPWSMAALPDGSVLVSERESGEIRRVVDGEVSEVGSLAGSIAAAGEGGLLGLAVGPDFATDPKLFAYLTSPNDNRIVSLRYDDDGLGDPEDILTGLPKANIHNGGRIKFGPDGFLYVGTGDAADGPLAQDPDSLAGKILRITADGEPAPGNPVEGSPVYSLGHRNVQGLAWDSAGQLWASEFGPEVDDELNLITPGGNYGWPEVTGAPGRDGFIDAQVVWPSTASSSPSGMAILDDVAYLGGLRGERLWQVPLQSGAAGTPVSHFDGNHGRLRDVIDAGNGTLWIATNEGTGSRILSVAVQ
ncbi:PQQ-dependent sugar dehydrogenase [Arthrobacter sp. AET 35A]|uniref:PQQ-dependent sugar dehydrogenase n=1 Tax=Arthrobacter sp. AET 35A TaxID=2292643 RepID=UPI001784ED14|nr:PQQ-dependent sugar dehydrogenase [Arthrobacter sp. AET 35A]MBE0011526.1 PQQ-dependent sugar dehydrogenase [Arthrobacter sp. AET 35A]